ncbi:MFS transporter [Streptomyces sp. NPDC058459]|uniref:MFS transporter n=1 Tax=Streptomyces sp. NPDC058459 TaxID=3346508 RepID=UPI003669148B
MNNSAEAAEASPSDVPAEGRYPAVASSRQRLVLVLLLASQFMLSVDFSILNVALPDVGTSLGFASSNVQWIATSFAVCAAGFMLLFGRLADYVGRRRMFLIGMTVLAAASLLGGFAQSPAVLIVARVLQGLATAAVTPAALSLLTVAFPDGPLRRRALGLSSVMLMFGFTAGAILGGVLTDVLSWRWAFLINVPVAIFVVAVGPFVLREPAERALGKLDARGAVLITAGLIALVYAATRFGAEGVGDVVGLVLLLVSIVLIGVFVRAEGHHPAPLVPMSLLRHRLVLFGHVAGLATFLLETGLVFLSTMYLQNIMGLNPLQTGLTFGAQGVGAIIGGTLAPRIIGASSVRFTAAAGLTVQGGFIATLVLIGRGDASLWLFGAAAFLQAMGHVCAVVAFMVAATSGLADREQGLATGMATMTQQVAIALGAPVLSAIATAAGGFHSLTALRTALGVDAALLVLAAVTVASKMKADHRDPAGPPTA